MATPASSPDHGTSTGRKKALPTASGKSAASARVKARKADRKSVTKAQAPGLTDPMRKLRNEPAPRQVLELARILHTKAPEDVQTLLAAASPAPAAAAGEDRPMLAPEVWGAAVTDEQVAKGAVENLQLQFTARRALEATSLSRQDVADLLGISAQAVTDHLEAGRLLGLKRGRAWLIPAWQLHVDTERGYLPRLGDLAKVFPGGLTHLSNWATRPSIDLDNRTPREALAHGDSHQVIATAQALTAAGW